MALLELPTHDRLAEVVRVLVGRNTIVTAAASAGEPSHAGLLLRRDDSIGAVVLIDLAGVIGMGGAMLLLPGAMGEVDIARGEATTLQVEAFRAVLTAIALECNAHLDRDEHMRLGDLVLMADDGDEVRRLIDATSEVRHMNVEVQGHARGVLSFNETIAA